MLARFAVVWILFLPVLSVSQPDESLLIGPGDLLRIQVFDTPELDQSARVNDAGDIDLLIGGRTRVKGLTPSEAAKTIEHNLVAANIMVNPHVQITVEQNATSSVTVIGEVKNPGAYSISTPRNALSVISLAGGLTDAAGRSITIERRNSKEKITYSMSNSASKAMDAAPLVYPGDIVFVPRAEIVYVLGDVGRPGGYAKASSSSPITVLEVIALAGGTRPSSAPSKARVLRKNPDGTHVSLPLALSAMQKGNRPDEVLQSEDIVYVPFSYVRNTLTGASNIVAAAGAASLYLF